MTELSELLHEKKDAVIRRWVDDTFATYASDTVKFLRRQKDPFANPVGNGVREGTRTIVEGLLARDRIETLREPLEAIIKVRAIQDFAPSQAIAFVFRLKPIIRATLGAAVDEPPVSAQLAELEEQIDYVALLALDIYVECREKVFELRINEVKRGVEALWRRWDVSSRENDPDSSDGESS